MLLKVTFYGVRGSTPCPSERNRRYGGNTACVTLESPGSMPLVLDLGTGLRFWGERLSSDGTFHGAALVTHIHWDHVQGLPFFVPVDRIGSRLDIYGPPQDGTSFEAAFDTFMRPPYFPVSVQELRGDVAFHDVTDADVAIGDAKVRVRPVPHVGATNGYRIDMAGASVAYISDHQQPLDGGHQITDAVLELCDGVDLLIHDAQYTDEEFGQKSHWGHCTVDFAVAVAARSGSSRLALFHHDPSHDDDTLDRMLASTRDAPCEVIAAAEGLTISLGNAPLANQVVVGREARD
ncbi:MAG: MBL fold metallo-hydrolase [Acidimicrobiales bacterium]